MNFSIDYGGNVLIIKYPSIPWLIRNKDKIISLRIAGKNLLIGV